VVASLAFAIVACSRPAPRTHIVAMRNFGFDPVSLTIAVGDTVVWANADFLPHTATARDGAWDSKMVGANGQWRLVGARPGTHEYYCVFHPNMTGTIVVR
jgi:plastocyanin